MEAALEAARAKDTKERLAGVERLHEALDAAARQRGLTAGEVTALVDTCMDLIRDANFRVAQGGLQALSAAAVVAGDHFKIHLNALVPAAVERLGDGKQPVREAARQLLITLMEVSSPTIIVERAGSYAWTHKSWRVREEFVRTVATAVGLFASTELPLQRVLLSPVLQLMNDSNQSVRDAAIYCIEEMYTHMGSQFHEELQRHNLPPYMLREINSRLERIEPKRQSKDKKHTTGKYIIRRDTDITEKPVEPVRVHSEKELLREFEKIAATLVPEKDWSVRIAAMQRIEALVYGGAIDYPSFLMLLKQLVPPLSTQLSDRRSSIVKQACHLLNVLSKELLGDFEPCAELFIPMLFKLVVITVLVIAESADTCIKTILRNCKISRILPRIADTAKNDRSAVLRARCCEYALLILEYWADAPEIQRSADLYEDLIKCCVADAMSEVRATARSCYRLFAKTWPERSRRLFMSFDPAIQRNSALLDSSVPSTINASARNGGSRLLESMTTQLGTRERSRSPYLGNISSESMTSLSLPFPRRSLERPQEGGRMDEGSDIRSTRRFPQTQNYVDMPYRDAIHRDSHNNHVPNFQRPLLRKQVMSRASASIRHSFDDSQVQSGDVSGYTDALASLSDALSEGLSPSSDWVVRVSAFEFIRNLLQQGQRGIQEITQNFEKVMKLFFRHLDDPHHKVAQAAFSTLAELIPACKKPFESYVERILPYVFSRLIDPKELVKKPCSSTLDVVGRTYAIDMLLPALVRSLDEQRSPKAKLAVLEFANKSFSKYTVDSEGYSNSGFLKLWLSKLAPLVHEKNAKLKEASISGIISVYSHFDSTAVLNFILNLSVEEQNLLRRALKQYTPRIEVDLVNYLQSKKDRPRPKSYDQADYGTSSEDGYALASKKSYPFGRYSSSSLDAEGGKWMNSVQESTPRNAPMARTTSDMSIDHTSQSIELDTGSEVLLTRSRESKNNTSSLVETARSWPNYPEKTDAPLDDETAISTPRLDLSHRAASDGHNAVGSTAEENVQEGDIAVKLSSIKTTLHADNELSIPQLLHQISNGTEVSSLEKREALQQLVKASVDNDISIWAKYFNQILTAVLEVLDDSDSSTREIALSLVAEMLNNQSGAMEESIEIVLEKLLHVTKDMVAKISNEANQCLNVLLAKYDPFRCLAVVVPLLVSDDEKTLVVCINSLTKLVGRLSEEELMNQLPTFLPALFDAFSNQSPDVRKTVVFCLVDIYIMLGKAFVPYLEGLNSTQLRLVTIYANRISQARSGAPIDANQ
ncbi:hypothetical protein OsJ_15396 [Oryza sativa Japonica Group]|uniref:TOG domain-containing protein n=1 Tax=Oryza sativa subsp. japonica TaxID=39947 RepID=B9FG20_ORYSJ|nr:hypothetical protein OsJ_15396 [Oryza sativa Japonica Group]